MTSTRVWVGFMATFVASSAFPSVPQLPRDTSACNATPSVQMLSVVGSMAGAHPVWLVDGAARWVEPTTPVKTLWVFAQPTQGVQVTGRRRGGVEIARFQRGGEPVTDRLAITNPTRASVRPGGASADVLKNYAFITSHVFYPVAGCWEFTVVTAGATHDIVRSVVAEP